MLTVEEFYEWERTSRDTIDLKRCYIDIAGDLVSGLLLSQIIYWFLPGEHGQKLRVEKEGKFWLAKGRTEWWDECRISPKQFDRAIQVLKAENLVEIKRFRFRGSPTIHIYLNVLALLESVNSNLTKGEITNQPKGELSSAQNGEMQVPEKVKSLTKTTPENSPKTTIKEIKRGEPSPLSMVNEVFKGIHAFYGFPEKTNVDPVPNYGKEGKAIKRMLARGFAIDQILELWMKKTQQAGQYKSMVYVNEDIQVGGNGKKPIDRDKFIRGKYGHLVGR